MPLEENRASKARHGMPCPYKENGKSKNCQRQTAGARVGQRQRGRVGKRNGKSKGPPGKAGATRSGETNAPVQKQSLSRDFLLWPLFREPEGSLPRTEVRGFIRLLRGSYLACHSA